MSGGQKSDTLHDNGIGWAIMFAIFAVLIWLFWLFYDHEVRNLVRWIRYAEMWIISWFIDNDYTVLLAGQEFDFKAGLDATPNYEKKDLEYQHMAYFAALAMQPWRMPIIALLSAGALWCMFRGPNTMYRRKMDIQRLIEVQSQVFPVISPFIKFNPSTQPPRPPGSPVPADLPLFAEALGPEEWLTYNSVKINDGEIDAESAAQAFRAQLGKPWRGTKQLADYKQILLAAFCLKASRKRGESDLMLGRIAKCWDAERGLLLSRDSKLLKEARKILSDKNLAGKTLAQANRHAFETTAMIRALQFAREEGGVLAPAQFVWLRAHDRALWYPLNNTGRQSFHMEALGAISHFKAEKLTQRPIPVPKVENAVETIRNYTKSVNMRPIPQMDYSNSKKRGIKKAV